MVLRSGRLLMFNLTAALLLCAHIPAQAQAATLLRVRNAASADRLVLDSAGGLLMQGGTSGVIPASGVGIRMMWYPAKAAFRAGGATGTEWDDGNTGSYSFAAGAQNMAKGSSSAVLGFANSATGSNSFVAGSHSSATAFDAIALGSNATASGPRSFAAGLSVTANGSTSVALGYAATSANDGAFTFADASTSVVFSSNVANQFSVRAAGGVRFYSNPSLTSGVTLAAGGGSWSTVSDRRRKEAFLALDGEDVLERIRTLPLSTWRYTAEVDRSTRHIGPMAQDWYRAFGFSRDSLTINTGDIDGVNLAGVQALEARTRAQANALREAEARAATQDARISTQERELAEARERIRRLEAVVDDLGRRLPAAAPR